VRALLALVGLALLFLGLASLGPASSPSSSSALPLPGSSQFSPPVVSVSGGLYFKAWMYARGTGGVMYLRCLVLDKYDGGTWSRTVGDSFAVGAGVVTVGSPVSFGGEVNLSAPLMGGCVPVATPSVDGLVLGSIRVVAPGASLAASREGLFVVATGGSVGRVASYYGPGAPQSPPSGVYLEVPPELAPTLKSIAANVTAGCTDTACKVARIKEFLSHFRYDGTMDSLWPSVPPGVDPVLWFLQEGRRGVCIHFASAFVLLARSAGVPARLVVGYVSDGPVPGDWALVAFSPHAWAEYYVEGVGWVGVEATPPGSAPQPLPVAPLRPETAQPPPPSPSLPQLAAPQMPEVPWPAVAVAAASVGALAYFSTGRRVATVGVGEEFLVKGPRGFPVYVGRRRVGRAPVAVVFHKPGLYVVRAGPLVYLVRAVDYRRVAGALFVKLLRRLGLPATITPRELAAARPELRELALAFERALFGPAVSKSDVEALRRAL